MATEAEHIPSTDTVRARYYLATVSDDTPSEIIKRGRAASEAEFNRWLDRTVAELRAQITEELQNAPAVDPTAAASGGRPEVTVGLKVIFIHGGGNIWTVGEISNGHVWIREWTRSVPHPIDRFWQSFRLATSEEIAAQLKEDLP